VPGSAPTPPAVAVADPQVAGTLPVTGPPPTAGSAQAVAIAPSAPAANAASAADPQGPSQTQSLFFLVTVVLLGLPALLLMTLLATVLTRR
jgi:hypothetical protein